MSITWGFGPKVTTVRAKHSEFRPMAEVFFPVPVSPANAKENRHLLAGHLS